MSLTSKDMKEGKRINFRKTITLNVLKFNFNTNYFHLHNCLLGFNLSNFFLYVCMYVYGTENRTQDLNYIPSHLFTFYFDQKKKKNSLHWLDIA